MSCLPGYFQYTFDNTEICAKCPDGKPPEGKSRELCITNAQIDYDAAGTAIQSIKCTHGGKPTKLTINDIETYTCKTNSISYVLNDGKGDSKNEDGNNFWWWILAIIVVILLIGGGTWYYKKRRGSKSSGEMSSDGSDGSDGSS